MKNLNVTEQLNAMQRMFLPPSTLSETMRTCACTFWENQDKILDGMQAFANDWFEHRHAGTRAALEAAERMCKAETPIDLLREYQEWASGAVQRVIADGTACQQQFMSAMGALGQPSASGKEAEPSQSEARPTARPKAA